MVKKAKEAKKQNVALIDGAGILIGYSKDSKAEGISVPDDCDLAPGKYRWEPKAETWLPLSPVESDPTDQPHILRAIARGFIAVRDEKPLPKETLDWLTLFEGSIDNIGGHE